MIFSTNILRPFSFENRSEMSCVIFIYETLIVFKGIFKSLQDWNFAVSRLLRPEQVG